MKGKYNKNRTAEQWQYVMLRAGAGLTIEDVARDCGVHKKTIYRFERGQYKIESDTIKAIKEYYNNIKNKEC